MVSTVLYSTKGCSFFITDAAPDTSLLIADAPSYAWAWHLERSLQFLCSNSKILFPRVWLAGLPWMCKESKNY